MQYHITYLKTITVSRECENMEEAAKMAAIIIRCQGADAHLLSIYAENYVAPPDAPKPTRGEERANGMLANIRRLTNPEPKGAA